MTSGVSGGLAVVGIPSARLRWSGPGGGWRWTGGSRGEETLGWVEGLVGLEVARVVGTRCLLSRQRRRSPEPPGTASPTSSAGSERVLTVESETTPESQGVWMWEVRPTEGPAQGTTREESEGGREW